MTAILEAVARARGCTTAADVAEFLDPLPALKNPLIDLMPEYRPALDRIARAIANGETVAIYGDYDVDGMSATVILFLFLQTMGANVRWFIPHRMSEDYGLTTAGASRCVASHAPTLVIAVDCGTNSADQVAALKADGIDTIIVDHHTPTLTTNGAVATLNPRMAKDAEQLHNLCAAGLVYLFVDQMVKDFAAQERWDRHRTYAQILAGLATTCDVVPLVGINRTLVKHAVHLANQPNRRANMPVIAALNDLVGGKEITAKTFGFEWGPRLNAAGRLDSANDSILLLLAATYDEAVSRARVCDETNNERRAIQDKAIEEASEAASQMLQAAPDTRVLVLANKTWHPGTVGIVAGRIKDQFNKPTVILGWSSDPDATGGRGRWRGSARSFEGFHVGAAISKAFVQGVVERGGGHSVAAGVSVREEKLDEFRAFLNAECTGSFESIHEVIGHVDSVRADGSVVPPSSWYDMLQRLAPFGNGNPQPLFIALSSTLAHPPKPRHTRATPTTDSKVFMLAGEFSSQYAGANRFTFDWFDVRRARDSWIPGRKYDVVVSLSRKLPPPGVGKTDPYYNWRVADCAPAA